MVLFEARIESWNPALAPGHRDDDRPYLLCQLNRDLRICRSGQQLRAGLGLIACQRVPLWCHEIWSRAV
jgi:hypothetical protein